MSAKMEELKLIVHCRTPSLNDWIGGKHWTKKNKDKKHFQNLMFEALKDSETIFPRPLPTPIEIGVIQYTALDRDHDNCIPALKYLCDMLVANKFIPDDNKKYIKRITHLENVKCNTRKEERLLFTILIPIVS